MSEAFLARKKQRIRFCSSIKNDLGKQQNRFKRLQAYPLVVGWRDEKFFILSEKLNENLPFHFLSLRFPPNIFALLFYK